MKEDFSREELDFAAGSVFGLRSFHLSAGLRSIHKEYTWTLSKDHVHEATCQKYVNNLFPDLFSVVQSASHEDQVPSLDCNCGFYMFKPGYFRPMGTVIGVVEGFGKTIIGDKGYRCEKMRIAALAPEPLADRNFERYFKSLLGETNVPLYPDRYALLDAFKDKFEEGAFSQLEELEKHLEVQKAYTKMLQKTIDEQIQRHLAIYFKAES